MKPGNIVLPKGFEPLICLFIITRNVAQKQENVRTAFQEDSDAFLHTLSSLDSGIRDKPSHTLSHNFPSH